MKKIISAVVAALSTLSFVSPAYAQDVNCGGPAAFLQGRVEINSAIGCIPVSNSSDFISFVLKWGIGIGGGIAFLLIVYASFMIITSSGNPERLKAGQELLTSAIAGIIMLIFSIFILRLIGINILGIFS